MTAYCVMQARLQPLEVLAVVLDDDTHTIPPAFVLCICRLSAFISSYNTPLNNHLAVMAELLRQKGNRQTYAMQQYSATTKNMPIA
jgi:hypothetical protein